MTKIQLGSGSSSASTHRVTRSSSTLNRQYVGRPSNLAIEEAAQTPRSSAPVDGRPSRLVNLRVHASDLAQLPPAPVEKPAYDKAVVPKVVEMGGAGNQARAQSYAVQENVAAEMAPVENVDYGMQSGYTAENASASNYAAQSAPVDFSQMVPPEESPIEDNMNYMPVVSAESQMGVVPYGNSMVSAQAAEVDTDALAMNIAADYATASLGASMQSLPAGSAVSGLGVAEVSDNSIDAIAHAASEAIASIRTATDPEEVAEQVTSLKAFAENIKASSAAPEMVELSETIEKFVDIAMKSTRVQEEVEKKAAIEQAKAKAAAVKKTVKKVAPKVARPVASKRVVASAPKMAATIPKATATVRRPVRATSNAARPTLKRTAKKVSPKLAGTEDQALRRALSSVAAMDGEPEEKTAKKKVSIRRKGNTKRFALAFFCATACVAAVIYFVASNIPDISVKVAAMQTGIEASYPAYIPRDYSLNDISSEEGKIVLTFKGPDKTTFSLSEEKSSWDSTTLLRNYVEPTWNSNYTTTHEQGITIYISGANATWVNGGVLYKIESSAGSTLTKKQLRNIVVSL